VATIEESKNLFTLSVTEPMGSLQANKERLHRFTYQLLNTGFLGKIEVLQ